MEFKQLNRKIISSWRIARVIRLVCVLIPSVSVTIFANLDILLWKAACFGLWVICAYCLLGLILYPPIEYRQWGYYIDEEKVVIRHGLFFIKQTIIPIIRIQNITLSQGPINRRFGLHEVEIALASGSHEIIGLDKETADGISESLRGKLYRRIDEKGVL